MTNSAVLDADVLFSGAMRDFLLRLAADGLFIPFWSAEIQNEWTRSVLRKYPDVKPEKLEYTCREMDGSFPKALIHGYDSLIPGLQLPDPDDRHVLAVAIHMKAGYIVTKNLVDFPQMALEPHGIKVLSPDDFVYRLIQQKPIQVLAAAKTHRSELRRPSKTADEYIAKLEQLRFLKTVEFLRKHKGDI